MKIIVDADSILAFTIGFAIGTGIFVLIIETVGK